MKAFVYILKSRKDDKYYIGSTINLQNRLFRHKNGYVPATKNRLPVELVFKKEFVNLSLARKEEYYIKKQKNSRFIEKLIVGSLAQLAEQRTLNALHPSIKNHLIVDTTIL
jgi:putative endonuclease